MGIDPVTAPATRVIDLAEMKLYARITTADEERSLGNVIDAATEDIQTEMGRQILAATYDETREDFANIMKLPKPPLSSVTQITYIDTDGNPQTLSSAVYDVDTTVEPGRVRLAYDQTWPAIRGVWNAVVIRFVAGWATPDAVPADIKHGIRLLATHYFDHRPAVELMDPGQRFQEVPWGIKQIIWRNKIPQIA
jgi:uncharacterized phiE125 gp8 family phage protein